MSSGVRVKNSFGNQKFGVKEKLIAAGTILASLAIGAVGGYTISNISSGYSKGKEYFIKCYQSFKPTLMNFSANVFRVFNEEGAINCNPLDIAKSLYPELKGEKINKKAMEIDGSLVVFYTKHRRNLEPVFTK